MTKIAVAKGDGIGPEIMEAVLGIFNAANVKLSYEFVDMGKWVQKSFPLGDTDMVLIENIGGLGCPARFVLVSISTQGSVQITPEFGTCSDDVDAQLNGDSITIAMSGFMGPLEPDEAQQKAANELHAFVYRAGIVHHFTPQNGAMTEVNL